MADLKNHNNVQLIFKLAQESRTSSEIVRVLFDRGIPTPTGYKAAHGFHGDADQTIANFMKAVE